MKISNHLFSNSKKIFAALVLSALVTPLFSESSVLEKYYGQLFKGNMMGKVITADMKIVDNQTIEFTANTPGGKKQHTYSYKIVSDSDGKLITEWYENEKLDKTVTFSNCESENFVIEVKGKGKVKMQK